MEEMDHPYRHLLGPDVHEYQHERLPGRCGATDQGLHDLRTSGQGQTDDLVGGICLWL